jgi:Flp pilus assembly protein TadG
MILSRKGQREGTILVESALIYPVLFLLIMGVILMGIAVFRYQQVSHISREAARWASVHGQEYENDTMGVNQNSAYWATPGRRAATADDIYNDAVLPQAAGMPNGALTYTTTQNAAANTITYTGTSADGSVVVAVTWNMKADGTPDKRPTRTVTVADATAPSGSRDVAQYNTVTVAVTYKWNTPLFGMLPVSCTSVNTIFY